MEAEESDEENDELCEMLIRLSVEKIRRGSPVGINSKKMFLAMDD